jgi:glycosyltransferase involved in cell wall biosynthesis
MRFSVLVNTYNRARFLDLALTAWRRQTEGDFEIVVADDGSEDGTAEVVRRHRQDAPFPVVHVVHERRGHRRAAILNRAIAATRAGVLLFTDADCLPAADLLARHAEGFRDGRMLLGGRVRLSESETAGMTPEAAADGSYERCLSPAWRRRLESEHRRNRVQIALRRRKRPHNLGVNFSVEKWALYAVNGYDENFEGWGNADGDLRERLKQVGVRPLSIWDRAVVYHLEHPPDPTRAEKRNAAYARRPEIPFWCRRGLVQVPPWANGGDLA